MTLTDYSENAIVSDEGTLNNYDTIDATDGIPLILNTGPAIINEAAPGCWRPPGRTLEIESNVTNNGQVMVEDGGTVD